MFYERKEKEGGEWEKKRMEKRRQREESESQDSGIATIILTVQEAEEGGWEFKANLDKILSKEKYKNSDHLDTDLVRNRE